MPRAVQRGCGRAGEDPPCFPTQLLCAHAPLTLSTTRPNCWPDFTESLTHMFTLFVLVSGFQGSPDELILVLGERRRDRRLVQV